jgi:hypothetical protein
VPLSGVRGVWLAGPVKDLIEMETVVVEGVAPGQSAEWTRITIKDRIRAQE